MDDREKLIELIMSSGQVSGFAGSLATYLIANGVVIQKQGEWEESVSYDVGFWVCSVCNFTSEATVAPKLYKYCPNCGAKMKEVK